MSNLSVEDLRLFVERNHNKQFTGKGDLVAIFTSLRFF